MPKKTDWASRLAAFMKDKTIPMKIDLYDFWYETTYRVNSQKISEVILSE